jgi:hypothetical protein
VRVDDLSWDVASGAIRFTVRACATFRFDSVVRGPDITGRITDQHTSTTTVVRLRRDDDGPRSVARSEWLAQTEGILKRRRPRC